MPKIPISDNSPAMSPKNNRHQPARSHRGRVGRIAAAVGVLVGVPAFASDGGGPFDIDAPSFLIESWGPPFVSDTAGGVTADDNYFLVSGHVRIFDANGVQSGTLLGQYGMVGLAHDGIALYACNAYGEVFMHIGSEFDYPGVFDPIPEILHTSGLASDGQFFYMVADYGDSIARRSYDGAYGGFLDVTSIGPVRGLTYIPDTAQLIAVQETPLIPDGEPDLAYQILVNNDSFADSAVIMPGSELHRGNVPEENVVGMGYNRASGNLVISQLHDAESRGAYANGFPPANPIPAVSTWGMVVAGLVTLTAGTLVYAHRRKRFAPQLE